MIAAGFVRDNDVANLQLSGAAGYKPHIAALYLNVANPSANSSVYNDGVGVMTSAQAKNIDKKIDDGAARTGRYQSHRAYNSTQGDCLDGVDGDYLLSNDQAACMGVYVLE
jgi:hypothetical protein